MTHRPQPPFVRAEFIPVMAGLYIGFVLGGISVLALWAHGYL